MNKKDGTSSATGIQIDEKQNEIMQSFSFVFMNRSFEESVRSFYFVPNMSLPDFFSSAATNW